LSPDVYDMVVGWLVGFMMFLTLFQLYCGGQFYWWKKPVYL